MKRIATFSSVLMLVAAAAVAGEVVKRGTPIAGDAKSVPLTQVLEKPEEYAKTAVVVDGVVLNACTRKGCWMELAPEAGKQGVRITFKDYGFFVPLDSKGAKARVEGVTVVKTLSKADADHLESEGAKLVRNPDGTAREVSFVANGVELTR
ncbi:MAG TPA: DUF4920 domain-containing protein [Thermoanaerobaculia bacterium]